jgi:hypothetical protein
VPCRVIESTSYNTKSDDGVGLSAKVNHATPCAGPYLAQSILFVRLQLKLLHGRGRGHHCTSRRLTGDQLPFGALVLFHSLVVSQSYHIQNCDVSANQWYVAVYDVSIRNTPTKVRAVHVVFEALTPHSVQFVLLRNS